jgi:VanZ family protein
MRKEFLPASLWALFILVACGIPGNRIPEVPFWKWLSWDKSVHLFFFGMLTVLLLRGEEKILGSYPERKKVSLWIAVAVAYGGMIELLQSFVFIQRSGDIRDAMANAVGAITGGYLFKWWRIKTKK